MPRHNALTTLLWYVVYTKPHAEEVARDHLEQKMIHVFLPRIDEGRPAPQGRQKRVVPLFPSYLFVKISVPHDYYKVIWAKGVKRMVGNTEGPLPLDDSIIDFLEKRTGKEGYIRPVDRWRRMDPVRVTSGPLEGLMGLVDGSTDSRGRVKVLMRFLREGSRVEVPAWCLEKC
ncbi:MAG: transcription termination/antitermination NusG family protein [bacterium]